MRTVISGSELLTPTEVIQDPLLVVEDGVVQSIGSRTSASAPEGDAMHFAGATLVPAFLDVHFHGCAGHDVMEGTQAALSVVGRFLSGKGVAAYLATTVTSPVDNLLRAVEGIADVIENGNTTGARPIGIHLEGPFISHAKRGVHPAEHLQQPSVALFERLWKASRGTIRLLTIAPELPDALEMIAHARQAGVRISLGHSNATAAEALAGVEAGAVSATHTFNAMRVLNQREPGILGVVLDQPDVFCELIADGFHVDPRVARLFWKLKGDTRGILITDAMSATGMPEGKYQLGSLEVVVRDGKCMVGDTIAGSVLTLDRAVKKFTEFTGASLRSSVRMATANPAAMIGASDYGQIAVGRPANVTVLAQTGEVLETFLDGRPAHS